MHYVRVSSTGGTGWVHPWPMRWWRSLTFDQRERRRGVMFVGLGVVFAVNVPSWDVKAAWAATPATSSITEDLRWPCILVQHY